MDQIQKHLLEQVAGLHEIPAGAYNIQERILMEVAGLESTPHGAYNIRANGETSARSTTANIDIVTKEDKQGIDIYVKPGTKKESLHIPVIMSQSGLTEMVYNDFHIGEDSDVVIVAGCGIHNATNKASQHDGIHSFFLAKNCKVKYIFRISISSNF